MRFSKGLGFYLAAAFVLPCEAFVSRAPAATGKGMIALNLPVAVKQSAPCKNGSLISQLPMNSSTQLAALPALASSLAARFASTRLVTKIGLFLSAAFLVLFQRKSQLLWPRTSADPAFSQPVPPGSLGCPFAGMPFFWGSRDYGAGAFYLRQAAKLPAAARRLWKFYFLGNPFVVVAGANNVKQILSQEFEPNGLRSATRSRQSSSALGTGASIISEQDKSRHQFLRRLIGQAITPAAVAKSIGNLQEAADISVQKMLAQTKENDKIVMEDICTDFTLDVAWRQILGLDLKPEEVPVFQKAVADWIGGLVSVQSIFGFGVEKTRSYEALTYLRKMVEQKIDQLEKNGPDSSTLSGMLFAKDEEDPTKTLSRNEVIDNAMILILAGSETSASTLTNAMLFLGLNPGAWDKLVEEQRRVVAKYGDEMSKETLDKECPYLEAVIKETMRIRPISGGIPRRATSTLLLNDHQIPKDWLVDFNVPLTHLLDPKTYKEDGSNMDIYKGFVPDRWLSPETAPSEFIPMGAGPRYCLGSNLAYAEMKVFLATLARKINFQLADRTRKVVWKPMSIIPKPNDGVVIKATPVGEPVSA